MNNGAVLFSYAGAELNLQQAYEVAKSSEQNIRDLFKKGTAQYFNIEQLLELIALHPNICRRFVADSEFFNRLEFKEKLSLFQNPQLAIDMLKTRDILANLEDVFIYCLGRDNEFVAEIILSTADIGSKLGEHYCYLLCDQYYQMASRFSALPHIARGLNTVELKKESYRESMADLGEGFFMRWQAKEEAKNSKEKAIELVSADEIWYCDYFKIMPLAREYHEVALILYHRFKQNDPYFEHEGIQLNEFVRLAKDNLDLAKKILVDKKDELEGHQLARLSKASNEIAYEIASDVSFYERFNSENLRKIAGRCLKCATFIFNHEELKNKLTHKSLTWVACQYESIAWRMIDTLKQEQPETIFVLALWHETIGRRFYKDKALHAYLNKDMLMQLARHHQFFALYVLQNAKFLAMLEVQELANIAHFQPLFAMKLICTPELLKKMSDYYLSDIANAHPGIAIRLSEQGLRPWESCLQCHRSDIERNIDLFEMMTKKLAEPEPVQALGQAFNQLNFNSRKLG